ncbi:hypothetical protein H2509_16530 [Stappia sp. F7233]|uniref:Xylulokinase n=1 Tax=Stappia albiluteola TaxID=2758565 RepID=A0A839AII0_9HYPH|nr:FGGY family carbohydrate kinase [Stappia albiluteola]MBA5778732.1 hypothetical protein [Stappia albiluteola]
MPVHSGTSSADILISADFGTSGVKVGAVDQNFQVLAKAVAPYPLSLPARDQAEQNPQDWWDALAVAIRQLSDAVENLSERTAALVFCAQMCGVLPVDEAGEPLRPCLIWLDKRSASLSRSLVGGFPSLYGYQLFKLANWLRLANGAPSRNGMDPTGKMLWLKQYEPDVFDRSHKLLDVKDWLIHRATGDFCMTADSANLTWLMDTRRGREGWSSALADRVGLPLDKLPAIVEGSSVVGTLTRKAAADLGLRPGLPVVGGGGDATATAVGSGAVDDGALHIYAGTSSWVSGFFSRRIIDVGSSFATITSSIGYRPLLIATQEAAGTAFGWLADLLGCGNTAAREGLLREVFAEPGMAQPSDPFFTPWLAGERVPVDDNRLRASFYGLSIQHDRKAIARSVAEGVAFNTRWAYSKVMKVKAAKADGAIPLVGGVAQNAYFAQMLADALNRPVVVGEPRCSGVLGAAAMASAALGWHGDTWSAARAIGNRMTAFYEPEARRVAELDERYRQLERVRSKLVDLYRSTGNGA